MGNPGDSTMRAAVDPGRGDRPAGGPWLRTSSGYQKEVGALQAQGQLKHMPGEEAASEGILSGSVLPV